MAALALAVTSGVQAAPRYDVIIRGGTIIDGSGLPGFKGDVALKGRFVAAVGDLAGEKAATVIDARGKVVAPGFINIHSHAHPNAVATAVNVLTQGVTTELINSDGLGPNDIPGLLAKFGANGLAENVGAYAPFNEIWTRVVGEKDRRATNGDVAAMRKLLEESLRAGAWGVAAGLDYKPAYYATVDEVVRVISIARPWRTVFANHDRVRPEQNYSSYKGMAETVAIGEQSGLMPLITHMKSQGSEQGNAGRVVDLMSRATSRGVYTPSDVYPYLAGQTSLSALIIPGWAQSGGREAMLGRFKDPKLRVQIIAEAEKAIALRFNGPKGVFIFDTDQELTDVMKALNVGAGEAVIRLIEESERIVILRFGAEQDLVRFLGYPDTAIACDCGATLERKVHPRSYGSFPRVLGRYVRDTKVLTLENAVRKMTALPANSVGMVDRGYLAPGMAADITVFDPSAVTDHATYEEPTNVSEGITHVFVNGQLALHDGVPTAANGGRALLRRRHMPSRPMTANVDRRLAAAGDNPRFSVNIAVEQDRDRRAASGYLQLLDRGSGTVWIADRLGTIQTAPGWASLTATLRNVRGDLRPIIVTADYVNGVGGKPSIVLDFHDGSAVAVNPTGQVRIGR
jgi:N-acyl-D-aspartate/D-glutamate deacylase